MDIELYCSGCHSCCDPCDKPKRIDIMKIGDRVKYLGRNGEIKKLWNDGTEQRAEVEYLRGGEIWVMRVATLLEENPKYRLSLVKNVKK